MTSCIDSASLSSLLHWPRIILPRQRSAELGLRAARDKAYPRMSNIFFRPGSSTLDEMIAQVDHGIFIDKCSSGMEEPQGWGIQVTCHYEHEIKGGKITERAFAPIGITGYVPDVLQSITDSSNALQMDGGYCGKGHKEIAPIASGGPHLLLTARLG